MKVPDRLLSFRPIHHVSVAQLSAQKCIRVS